MPFTVFVTFVKMTVDNIHQYLRKSCDFIGINECYPQTKIYSWCEKITTITIPENVTELGDFVFDDCKKLESVYCRPITPPSQMYENTDNAGLFSQNAEGRKIYVPNESVDAYKSAQGWSLYADDIVGYNF